MPCYAIYMELNLTPGKSIGPFKLGEPITPYLSDYLYHSEPSEDEEPWDEYDFGVNNDIEVYINKTTKIIESLACRKSCLWNSRDLIGMPISEFMTLPGEHSAVFTSEEIELEDETQTVY